MYRSPIGWPTPLITTFRGVRPVHNTALFSWAKFMNQITALPLSMSSAEIAEVTGKQLSHVNRDIISMASELYPEMDNLDSVGIFISRKLMNGRSVIEGIRLDRNNTECLITGYSAQLRMKVIARLRELEQLSKPQLPDFTNPAAAARAWADQVDAVMQLESKVAADAPKVDFADRVEKSSGVLIGHFAKAIGVGPNRLFAWMRANGYLIATAGSRYNTPYQKYLERGYFDVTEGSYEANGETRASFTTHITGKGQLRITEALKECGMIGEVAK